MPQALRAWHENNAKETMQQTFIHRKINRINRSSGYEEEGRRRIQRKTLYYSLLSPLAYNLNSSNGMPQALRAWHGVYSHPPLVQTGGVGR